MNLEGTVSAARLRAGDIQRRARCTLALARHRLREHDMEPREFRGSLRGRLDATAVVTVGTSRRDEVRKLLFKGGVEERAAGPASQGSAHLCVSEAWPWETSDADSFVIQPWTDARATPGTEEREFVPEDATSTMLPAIRRARASGLSVRETRDTLELERFYDDMFVPGSRFRFGDDTVIPDRATFLSRGADEDRRLLWIERDHVPVAGWVLVVSTARQEAWLPHAGISPALREEKTLFSRADTLAFAAALREAGLRGFEVNLALSRPFLDDGVFQHKRLWGCRFQPVPALPRFRVRVAPRHLHDVMAAAPFIHVGRDGMHGAMAFCPRTDRPSSEVEQIALKSVFPGLRGMDVHVRAGTAICDALAAALPAVKHCNMTYVADAATGSGERPGIQAPDRRW